MRYRVGIDLGTSFTSVAVSDPHGTRMVALSPTMVVPSVAFPAPDGSVLTGPAALAATADPARVARGFKRRLGDPTPLMLGGAGYSPAMLMAAQLRDVLATVTRAQHGPPASIVLTCPAIWGPYRREQFAEVPRLAGVTDFQLITEPEAAATHYSAERRLGDGEVVAVYDLGGGTFDTTILRMRADGMEILGTPEGIEHMGGTDFDETLLAHLDDRLGGAISELDPGDPAAIRALAAIRERCVHAKEALSTEPDVTVSLPLPAGAREVTVTRREFNDMIRPSVRQTIDALHRTVASAGLLPDDPSAVLLAGGSSRIPLVSQLVSEEFGKPVRGTLHPKFTVALGAAATPTRAPIHTPPPPSIPAPRRKWLVPAIAVTAVAVVGVATTLLLTPSDDTEKPVAATSPTTTTSTVASPDTSSATSETTTPETTTPTVDTSHGVADTGGTGTQGPAPLRLLDGRTITPSWVGLLSSDEDWDGTRISANGARQGPISAAWDGAGGLRVTWGDAAGELYLLTSDDPQNLQSYVDSAGALVFDVTVHQPPTDHTTMAVNCDYPCGGEVVVTNLYRNLPPEQATTVRIPLSCFTAAGLDATKVDTPFLVYTEKPFDATFANVRWEQGAATAPGVTPCADLH
jgi:actin-like ATPase involved in cell morphogenesis